MILIWLKIIWYKINKRQNPATPGTEPHTRAGATRDRNHWSSWTTKPPAASDDALPPFPYDEARCASCDVLTDDCTCMPGENSTEFSLSPVTMSPGRLADLYRRGLVYAPTENEAEDRLRAQLFAADRAERERQGLISAGHCPCSGRHYPSDGSCRWCTCHDPYNVHHLLPGESRESVNLLKQQIMKLAEIPVRPSDEIVKCRVCGHPQHPVNVFWCPGSVPSAEPSGGIEQCRCDGTRILDQDGRS